jgi:histidinol-phosphatase (PHP family)
VIFEINTGAVMRGYRRAPYPAVPLLRRICERGGRVVINSDAHTCDHLLGKFDEAMMLAKNVGFGSVCELTADGWRNFR